MDRKIESSSFERQALKWKVSRKQETRRADSFSFQTKVGVVFFSFLLFWGNYCNRSTRAYLEMIEFARDFFLQPTNLAHSFSHISMKIRFTYDESAFQRHYFKSKAAN